MPFCRSTRIKAVFGSSVVRGIKQVPSSLRGVLATKQSRPGSSGLDCFAPLAMTRQSKASDSLKDVFAEVRVPGDVGKLGFDIGAVDGERRAGALLGVEA